MTKSNNKIPKKPIPDYELEFERMWRESEPVEVEFEKSPSRSIGISMRIPRPLLKDLSSAARAHDLPLTTYIRNVLEEKMSETEFGSSSTKLEVAARLIKSVELDIDSHLARPKNPKPEKKK